VHLLGFTIETIFYSFFPIELFECQGFVYTDVEVTTKKSKYTSFPYLQTSCSHVAPAGVYFPVPVPGK
jgi:hypothetical protein